MNTNEIFETISEMNKADFAKLLQIVEAKKTTILQEQAAEMMKKISLDKFVSYQRGKKEVWGQVTAINKKVIFIEVIEGDKKHRRTLEYTDVLKVADTKPVIEETPQESQVASPKPVVDAPIAKKPMQQKGKK